VAVARARSVVLDLTGVSAPDDAGLAALLGLVGALRLLGARAILTGIRPELAGALAAQGVSLSGVQIFRSLAEGIDACRGSAWRPRS
jgi:anti-anti-sigma regulatory factor